MTVRALLVGLALAGGGLFLHTPEAVAQAGTVTGTVTNKQSGQPLPGAQVNLVNTRFGGVTDSNGRFNILNVPAGTYTVAVTFLGYAEGRQPNVLVRAGQPAALTFQLEEAVLSLQQLVVTGVTDPTAGVKLPFTVAKLDSTTLGVPVAGSAVAMISGKVAGAYITRSSGRPGSDVEVQLRSPTAFETSSRPLYVVDGVIVATDNLGRENNTGSTGLFRSSPLADIDPSEIENIEVIKGAAAASLYGSRAAAGVISITTKRGKNLPSGTTRITSRTELGRNSLMGQQPITTTHHYMMNTAGTGLINTAGRDTSWSGRTPRTCSQTSGICGRIADQRYPGPTYDNLHALYNPGEYFSNTLNVMHSTDATTLLVNLSRRHDAGALIGNDGREAYNGRVNIDHRLGDKLSLSFVGSHGRTNDDVESGNPFTSIMTYPVYVDLTARDAEGNYLILPDSTVPIENPVWRQGTRDNFSLRARTQGSLNTRYALSRWVTLDAQLSYDRADSKAQEYVPKGVQTSVTQDAPSNGSLSYEYQENNAINGSLGTSIVRQIGRLNARFTGRGTFEKEWRETFGVDGEDFIVKGTRDLTVTRQADDWSSSTADIRANAVLGGLDLDFKDRYITSFSVRHEGSSLFGATEKWHTYKRASAKYRLSQEEWFRVPFIDELGIRYAMGEAGGRPGNQSQYESWNTSRTAGLTRETAGNPQLKPSFTREHELGADMILFNNKLSVELVYVRQKSTNQVIIVPATVATGFSSLSANAGELIGNSLEATLQFNAIRKKDFTWTVNLVANRDDSKLTEWDRSCFFGSNTVREHEYTCAGQRMGDFVIFDFVKNPNQLPSWLQGRADEFQVNDDGYLVWVGRDQAGAIASWRDGLKEQCYAVATCGWGKLFTANGFTYRWGEPFLIRDNAGVLEHFNLGRSFPDVGFGFTHNVQFRDISLYAGFRGQIGGKIYNRGRNWAYVQLRHGDLDQSNRPDELKKTIDYYQRGLGQSDDCNSVTGCGSFYSEFLEDASYLKFAELSLRYRLKQPTLRKALGNMAPTDLTVGASATELFTITGYTGWDPEGNGRANSRQEAITYPFLRQLRFTVDLTF
jgi:TonB-linked SusC/RagA family outer membrane protein